MLNREYIRPSRRKKIAAVAAAFAVGAGLLTFTSFDTATAAVGDKCEAKWAAKANLEIWDDPNRPTFGKNVTDTNTNDDFIKRYCTTKTGTFNVYTDSPASATFPDVAEKIGTIKGGTRHVFLCQKQDSSYAEADRRSTGGNPWFALTVADNVTNAQLAAGVQNVGWVSVRHLTESTNRPEDLGLPNCDVRADIMNVEISDRAANSEAGYRSPSTGGTRAPAATDASVENGNNEEDCEVSTETVPGTEYVKHYCNFNLAVDVLDGNQELGTVSAGRHWIACQQDHPNFPNPRTRNSAKSENPLRYNNNTHWAWTQADGSTDFGWAPLTYMREGAPGAALAGVPSCTDEARQASNDYRA